MNDNKLLNEAYNQKVVKEDVPQHEGPYSTQGEAIEGWKVWIGTKGIDTDHPQFRLIKEAYIEGFYDAKNIYHEVEDDWDSVKRVVHDPDFMGSDDDLPPDQPIRQS